MRCVTCQRAVVAGQVAPSLAAGLLTKEHLVRCIASLFQSSARLYGCLARFPHAHILHDRGLALTGSYPKRTSKRSAAAAAAAAANCRSPGACRTDKATSHRWVQDPHNTSTHTSRPCTQLVHANIMSANHGPSRGVMGGHETGHECVVWV